MSNVIILSVLLQIVSALSVYATDSANDNDSAEFRFWYEKAVPLQNTRPDSVVIYADHAAEAIRHSAHRKEYCMALSLSSEALVDVGRPNEGFQLAKEVLHIAEELGDTLALAHSLFAIGYVVGQQINTNRNHFANNDVMDMLRKAHRFAQRLNDSVLTLKCLNGIGRTFRIMNQFDSGAVYHKEALKYAVPLQLGRQESWALHGLSVCSEAQGNLREALQYCLEALRLRENNTVDLEYAISLRYTLHLYTVLRDFPTALKYAKKDIIVAESCGDLPVLVAGLENLSSLYVAMGRYKEAFEANRRFSRASDSLAAMEYSNDAEVVAKDIELERAQREKIVMQKQEEQSALLIKQQYVIVAAIAALAVLLLVTIVIRVRSERKILLRNQELQEANTIIEKQYEELHKQSQSLAATSELLQNANTFLSDANARLEERDIEKNEILGIVAHDLKNPIAAVRGLAELVNSGFVEPEQTKEITEQISTTADRMLELVKNLLDINRLESGGMQFEFVEFSIAPLVESTVWQYKAQAEAKNITLHYASKVSSSIVLADEQAMIQVLDNIISNAVKHSPHGKNVFIRIISGVDAIRVEVQDEGQGISLEDMTKLFGKFARLSARPTGGEHSTGLGLSIVKKMVEAMQGRVWCESEVGKGATFIVELPCV
jgi:signal transduction histidine kinase